MESTILPPVIITPAIMNSRKLFVHIPLIRQTNAGYVCLYRLRGALYCASGTL
ncbi:MAG: hypothetical protein WA821_07560 [Anaerolineales bacterium]